MNVVLNIHNIYTCDFLNVPSTLNYETILQGPQLTFPDGILINESKMNENNNSFVTNNYITNNTKNFNPSTNIDSTLSILGSESK